MLTLSRVSRAFDLVRSGRVIVNGYTLNKLCKLYLDAHSTEFFANEDEMLVSLVEAKGSEHDARVRVGLSAAGGHY